jgi:hypothetical protein
MKKDEMSRPCSMLGRRAYKALVRIHGARRLYEDLNIDGI